MIIPYIFYQTLGEPVVTVYPSGEVPIPQLIPMVVPAGANYKVVEELPPPYDSKLYTLNLTPEGDPEPYTIDPLPLPEAKANCVSYEQNLATTETADIATASGYTGDVLTTTAALPEVSRPAAIQDVFDAQSAVVTELVATIAAINAATSVDEINNIVNPPSGTLQIYRTGTTLEESFYVTFNSSSLTEADTELYIPGTTEIITYSGGTFPRTPSAFPSSDYLIQIRVSSSGQILKEFEVSTTPTDVTF